MMSGIDIAGGLKGILLVLLPIAGSVLVAFGVFQVVMDLRKTNQKRMLERLKDQAGPSAKKKGKSSVVRRRLRHDERIGIDKLFAKFRMVGKLETMLEQANVDWSVSRMLINLLAISAATLCVLLMLKFSVIGSVGIALGVVVLPILWLMSRRKRRMNRLLDQLPDVFELMSQALRAGHSLASGVHLISEQMPDPAGTEFGRVFHEQNLGIKIEEALQNMADRVEMLDIRFFVTAVLIQRQTGGDLAEVLDNIGAVIRDRITLFGLVRGLTAEGRLSGWTLLALPVLVFVVELVINPSYVAMLIYDETGRMLLIAAIIMQLLGLAMIRKIVNIKV